jgi:cellobiose phosphorylase
MDAVDEHLVRRADRLVQLLDPPFDESKLDPGYIRGYVPGVRENGGQYTHAAIWASMAFAALGDHHRAWDLFSIINPVNHALNAADVETYRVEPYVVAADVYAAPAHLGRGGWTWYTGSAGWMYRLIIESLLGMRLEVDRLVLRPCLPPHWPSFTIHYRYRETMYHVLVVQHTAPQDAGADVTVRVDGVDQRDAFVPLVDDRREHHVEVRVPVPVPAGTPSPAVLTASDAGLATK